MDSQSFLPKSMALIIATVVVNAAACGPQGGVPLEEFQSKFWQAWCQNFVECRAYPDMETCLAANDFPGTWPISGREDSVRVGTMRYDAEKGAACIEWARTWGCTRSGEPNREDWMRSCGTMFQGTRRIGQSCLAGECVDRHYCDIPSGCADACCEGVCAEGIEPGSIEIGGECGTDYNCEYSAYCKDGTCQPFEAEGAPCSDMGWESCASGLTCFSSDAAAMRICQRLPGHGEPCAMPNLPASCDDYRDFCDPASLTCVSVRAIGEPCNTPGVFGECEDLGLCSAEGVCEAFPVTIGEDCAAFNSICLGELECASDGLCAAPLPIDCYPE